MLETIPLIDEEESIGRHFTHPTVKDMQELTKQKVRIDDWTTIIVYDTMAKEMAAAHTLWLNR
jgi:hypothetical protein